MAVFQRNLIVSFAVALSLLFITCAKAPEAFFSTDVNSGSSPLTVKFTDQSKNKPAQWNWDFGDGSSSSEQNPSHTYTKAGTFAVKLTSTNQKGSNTLQPAVKIAVSPGVLDKISIEPVSITLAPGETHTFTLRASDSYGNDIDNPQTSWRVTQEAGVINDKGVFTAATKSRNIPDAVQVEVTKEGVTRQIKASVIIAPGPLEKVTVLPAQIEFNAGGTQQFRAQGFDRFGNELSNLIIRWSASAGSIGSTGMLNAGTKAGTYPDSVKVDVTQGSITRSGTAAVIIKPDSLASVKLVPANVSLQPRNTQQLIAAGEDQYGNQISGLEFRWQVATIAGTIDQKGFLTAGTRAGNYKDTMLVRTTQGGTTQEAKASMTITPDSFDRVILMPDSIELGMGMQQQFRAQGVDRFGNKIPDLIYTWKAGIGGGTIGQSGLFIAGGKPGKYDNTVEVEARKGDITKVARATVVVEPDRVSFLSNRDGSWDIYMMDADGTNLKRQTRQIGELLGPRWSPDGQKIIYTKISYKDNKASAMGTYNINADGSGIQLLTPAGAVDMLPDYSPDGRLIAFSSMVDENLEIFVMNADGSNRLRLTRSNAMNAIPRWSPDGKIIAFLSNRDGNYEIYVMNADGSGQTRLTSNSYYEDAIAWSPDGSKIAFVSVRDGNYEIYIMYADGSGVKRLTNNSYQDGSPNWSPDGKKITFTSDRSGHAEIFIMNIDGTEVINLTKNDNQSTQPFWLPRKKGIDPASFIPSLDARATSVVFFEGPSTTPAAAQRVYTQKFPRTTSRYIYWQVNLRHQPLGRRADFELKAVWYRDGTLWREQSRNSWVEASWTDSHHSWSWGSATPPYWTAGEYTVDIYIENEKVASGQFEIY